MSVTSALGICYQSFTYSIYDTSAGLFVGIWILNEIVQFFCVGRGITFLILLYSVLGEPKAKYAKKVTQKNKCYMAGVMFVTEHCCHVNTVK